jgi:hypothetical protein
VPYKYLRVETAACTRDMPGTLTDAHLSHQISFRLWNPKVHYRHYSVYVHLAPDEFSVQPSIPFSKDAF